MSQQDNTNSMNPFGPWQALGEANMNAWSRMMTNAIRRDVFTQVLGNYLDTYLTTSEAFQKAIVQYMNGLLPRLSLPSRNEVTALAEHVSTIEQCLNDLDAKTEQRLQAFPDQVSNIERHLNDLDAKTERSLQTFPAHMSNIEQRLNDLIEKRLNDLDAKIEQRLQMLSEQLAQAATSTSQQSAARADLERRLQALDDNIMHLLQLVEATNSQLSAPKAASSSRRRKPNSPEQSS
jgi:chromosome segregation ATPase